MPSINATLDIARWSLYASQMAIEITSHNIANANTQGYSKQSLVLETGYPITISPGQIGTGVRATQVMRAYDQFVNEQVCSKSSDYYYWRAYQDAMESIETIFNDSEGYGINQIMGEFWNAWSDLSNNPEGVAERNALLGQSDNLIQVIRDIDSNLRVYQTNLDNNIQGAVSEINSITAQIADMNARISSSEINGSVNANDLRDQRDLLLEELSGYMDISYYEEEQTGQIMVYILGGTPLVMGNESYALTCQRDTLNGHLNVAWNGTSGQQIDITHKLDSGKLSGWIDVRDNEIDSYLDTINTFTEELIWQVNSLHAEGAGLKSVSSMTGSVEIADPALAIDGQDIDGNYYYAFGDRFVADGSFDVAIYDSSGTAAGSITVTLSAGSTVNDLIAQIDGFCNMNAGIDASTNLLSLSADTGYTFVLSPSETSESNNAPAILGLNTFFTWGDRAEDYAGTIDINAALEADPDLIAAGYPDSGGRIAPGDNRVALAIYELQDRIIEINGSSTTLDGYYNSFVAEVGTDVKRAQVNEQFNEALLSQYIQKKESVSGVNLDEEMADLLKFQHLYQTAAKLIATIDEMMQTLLSMKQ